MNKAKKRSVLLPVVLIVLSICLILGTTLAYFTDTRSTNTPVNFGKIEISVNEPFETTIPLKDALPGDKIVDKISFSKAVDSEAMYVRVKALYETTSEVEAVQSFVNDLNTYDLNVKEYITGDFVWTEKYGDYFYLAESVKTSNVYDIQNSTEIIFSVGIDLPREMQQIDNYAQFMETISFNVEIQAIQSVGVSSVIRQVDKKFALTFGGEAELPALPYTTGQYTEGDYAGRYYIEMGMYPQTLLTDDTIKSNLTLVAGETYTLEDATAARAECPVYQYGDDKYVKFEMPSNENGYYSNHTHLHGVQYYKIEPVRWIVIGDGDGNALPDDFDINATTLDSVTVVSEKILIQQIFDSWTQVHPETNSFNDWENSPVRPFMNEVLLNEIFDESELSCLQNINLKTTYQPVNQEAVELESLGDKLFLLATMYQDGEYCDNYTVNLLNGNTTVEYGVEYSMLQAKVTDLATATGVYTDTSTGYGEWWLRSGRYDRANYACIVYSAGKVTSNNVYYRAPGIRAAFVLGL